MSEPRRVLFVFAWLVVGGEETEVRHLARRLNPAKWRVEVAVCFHKPGMPEQTHRQLEALGVPVDTTGYGLSFEDTVDWLSAKMAGYDLVVACQAVPDVHPALKRMASPPPLIEHGGLVAEALRGPKDLTARYVGVCDAIRDAAASVMPGREAHAIRIPSMIDLEEFRSEDRDGVRAELGTPAGAPLIGWVGRLDRKKRVEDFLEAAAQLRHARPAARFIVVGGPDAFMPEYADELRARAADLDLRSALAFLGDRADVPRLLAGFDVLAWLSEGEGLPHVVAEAGAAALPVVATADDGVQELIEHQRTGLLVPHRSPASAADAIGRLLDNADLARRLAGALHRRVRDEYDVAAVVPRWEALFDQLVSVAIAGGKTRADAT